MSEEIESDLGCPMDSYDSRFDSTGLKKKEFNAVMSKYTGYCDAFSESNPYKSLWVCLGLGDKGPMGWYLSFVVYDDPMGDGKYYHLVNNRGFVRFFKNADSAVKYAASYGPAIGSCHIGWA